MDIRSFFAPKGGAKPPDARKKETVEVKKKKRPAVISDSDSEGETNAPVTKKSSKPASKDEKAPKLKAIEATDFFASKETKTHLTPSKKRKEADETFVNKDNPKKESAEALQGPVKKKRTESPEFKPSLSSKLASKAAESNMNTQLKTSPTKSTTSSPIVVSPKPASSNLEDSVTEVPGTPQEQQEEKKLAKQAAFKKFLSRGGAKNPGSKEIPKGSPDCLAGSVFVLSGVFESLEREEAGELIKKLGGKVTSSVSKNTTYLVAGEEAGASKLEKAAKCGTRVMSEDELLDLIREKTVKEKENKTPKTSPEKKEEVKADVKREKIQKTDMISGESKVSIPKVVKTERKQEALSAKFVSKHISPEKPRQTPTSGLSSSGEAGATELWVEKYRPLSSKNVIGQQGDRSNMNKLKIWLRDWNSNHLSSNGKKGSKPNQQYYGNDNGSWAKCALLSGPPGVGKTTTAYLVSKELGFDVVEMNASDTRSKKMLTGSVADTLNTTSVASMMGKGNENCGVTSKRVLLMDEVDGMAGNEDRGGVAELIQLLKTSKVPVIAMCNDRQHQKIRSLANHCFDLRFQRPRVEQIKAAMMSVCFKEKIQIKPEALTELIVGCGQDVRQVLHHLSMVKASNLDSKMEASQAKKEAESAKKTSIKIGPWDVCKSVFSAEEQKSMSLFDKSDLYFHDYNLAGLFVQQNYLSSKPVAAGGDRKKVMELVSQAADSIAEGDLVERGIRSGMNWSLLPTAAVFCSVLPGEYMSGFLIGQIEFPQWLGKNSRRSKLDRILSELQGHTRLTAGVSKGAVTLDYGQRLREHIVSPMSKLGAEGVDQSVTNINDYNLLREDLDGLMEVTQWPGRPDPWAALDSKVKAAFTRKYNKEAAALPFAVQSVVTKKAKSSVNSQESWGEDDDDVEEEEEDKDDIEKDAMIKAKVKKITAAASKKVEAGGGKGKGTGKGKGKGK